jgi:hypothetical protein
VKYDSGIHLVHGLLEMIEKQPRYTSLYTSVLPT